MMAAQLALAAAARKRQQQQGGFAGAGGMGGGGSNDDDGWPGETSGAGGRSSSPPAAAPMTNRAGESKSPYVLAHRDGPVHWQPLAEETVERARREGKLIFMNIGFRACHCMS